MRDGLHVCVQLVGDGKGTRTYDQGAHILTYDAKGMRTSEAAACTGSRRHVLSTLEEKCALDLCGLDATQCCEGVPLGKSYLSICHVSM